MHIDFVDAGNFNSIFHKGPIINPVNFVNLNDELELHG